MKKKLFIINSAHISKGVKTFRDNLVNNIDSDKWDIHYLEFKSLGLKLYDKYKKGYKLRDYEANIFINPAPSWLLNKKSYVIVHDLIPLEFLSFKYKLFYLKPTIKYFIYFLSWKFYKGNLKFVCISKSTQNKLREIIRKFFLFKKYKIQFGYQSITKLNESSNEDFKESIANQRSYRWMAFNDSQPHKNPKIILGISKYSELLEINSILICKNVNTKRALNSKLKVSIKPNNQTLRNIYLDTYYLIYPSKCEGFGLPILEALSFDVIPLIYPSKVNIEIYGKNYKFFFNNLNSLKDLIKKIPSKEDIIYISEVRNKIIGKVRKNSIFNLINNEINK